MNSNKFLYEVFIILFLLTSPIMLFCQGTFVTKTCDEISQVKHDTFVKRLEMAKLKNNYYEESLYLAHLKGNSVEVYSLLEKSIKLDSSLCREILKSDESYNKLGYKIIFIDTDYEKWKNICSYCRDLHLPNANYKTRNFLKFKKRISEEYNIDSTKFDFKLISILDTISEIYKFDINSIEKVNMKYRKDKYNRDYLISNRVNQVIKEYGYPSYSDVGFDHLYTIWQVLNHISDYEIRKKNLPIIEKAVKDGKINKIYLDTYISITNRINKNTIKPLK